MYVPKHFAVDSQIQQHALIEKQSFGVLVSDDLEATHLPFVLHKDEGEHGTLYGHFARANPQWQNLEDKTVLVIFSGPHAYISPAWYQSAPAVPTWNYVSVHVKGRVSLLSAEATTHVLNDALAFFDPTLLETRDVVTEAFQAKLSPAIVGFKIAIDSIQGMAKLSQNKPEATQANIRQALTNSSSYEAKALAECMVQANLTKASR